MNEHARRGASKRGGNARHLDIDQAERLLASDDPTPDEAYERAWAFTVFERGLTRLQGEYDRGEREGPFDALQPFFTPNPPSYKEAATQYGLTEAALTSLLHRARKRLREIVHEEIS